MAQGTQKDLWGHPRGLFVLFLTEMWERFSYYGMRALLVYYMIKQLMYPQAQASHIYGLYTGFVYLTPFFGGIIADRFWGRRKTVIVGGVLMAVGHFLMAFEAAFIPALLFLIMGNGAFKPNISSQVGTLYPRGDPRRDRGFSVFYVGINLGAFFSPLVCGTLGEVYGWGLGFGAAGVGMVVGLVIYLVGQPWLGPEARPGEAMARDREEVAQMGDEKTRLVGLIAVGLVSVAFWAAFEQQGNTIALWADANTDRTILGWAFPASWVQSLNPAFVFLCAPLVTSLWASQFRKGAEPSAATKMAIGCFLLGCGFLVMIPAAIIHAADGQPVSILWLVFFTLLATIGELYLSPVGLSLVTKLSPARMVSMMMGIWFSAAFFGNYGAGFFGSYWELIPKEFFFLGVAAVSMAAGVAILIIREPLKKRPGMEGSF